MFGGNGGINSSANVKLGGEADVTRVEGAYQVVEDLVGQVLVKTTLVAVTPEVKFPRFKFNAILIRNILQFQCGKVGLAGFWAQTSEFWRLNPDGIIP